MSYSKGLAHPRGASARETADDAECKASRGKQQGAAAGSEWPHDTHVPTKTKPLPTSILTLISTKVAAPKYTSGCGRNGAFEHSMWKILHVGRCDGAAG